MKAIFVDEFLQMSGVRATKSGDAFRLEQKFEEVTKTNGSRF